MNCANAWTRYVSISLSLVALACGGGPSSSGPTPQGAGSFEVHVSAGAPVSGAQVTLYAVNEATGETNTAVGDRGVIGRGGPTDASGKALVRLLVTSYAGPVQVAAGGQGVSYVDPTTAAPEGTAPRVVQVPATFSFTSFIPSYRSDAAAVVPVTLLTTLADREALAYARGRHPSRPSTMKVMEALTARDPLFVAHFTKSEQAWSPGALRTTVPAALTVGPATLGDTAYAALYDVALNQLARDVAARAGYGPDSQGVNAITLAQLLEQDIDADAMLDGRADGGRPVAVIGTPAVPVDSLFLRKSLAQSLDGWIRNRAVNKSGISSSELAAAQVYAAISTDTSDLFGAAAVELFDPIDKAAPVVSFASPAAKVYTNNGRASLQIRAEDVSGLKGVYAAAGGQTFSGVLAGDGTWSVEVSGLVVGTNPVIVWAEDLAEPASNSGRGVEGRQLSVDVVYDPTPPAVTYDGEFASYQDERDLSVAVDGNGRALVPASYVPARAKTSIPRNGEIWKASTRLAGGALDVAELESTNAANVPVLRFGVAYNADTESPIVQATYSVSVSCAGCPQFAAASGALLASPNKPTGGLYYDLPLATEHVPALASVVGPAAIAVALEVRDAAGNTTAAGPFAFTFHVVGPPLAVHEDSNFTSYPSATSTHNYRLDSYSTLWSATQFSAGVRLVRYVVTNPAPAPVAMRVSWAEALAGASWRAVESWRGYVFYEPGSTYLDNFAVTPFVLDGHTFYQTTQWAVPYGSRGAGAAGSEMSPWPCTLAYENGGMAAHRIGDGQNRFVCAPSDVQKAFYDSMVNTQTGTNNYVEVANYSQASVTPQVYYPEAIEPGAETTPALPAPNGMVVVPAATAAGPGMAVLYLTRPATAPRSRQLTRGAGTGAARFETWDWELWAFRYKWTYWAWVSYEYHTYRAWRWGRYLEAASDVVDGTLTLSTQGFVGNSALGEARNVSSAVFTARTVATH